MLSRTRGDTTAISESPFLFRDRTVSCRQLEQPEELFVRNTVRNLALYMDVEEEDEEAEEEESDEDEEYDVLVVTSLQRLRLNTS